MSGIYEYRGRTPSPNPYEQQQQRPACAWNAREYDHSTHQPYTRQQRGHGNADVNRNWPYPARFSPAEPTVVPVPVFPEPAAFPQPLLLHPPLLDPLLEARSGNVVIFDMSLSPSLAGKLDASRRRTRLTSGDKQKPACHPQQNSMVIVIPQMSEWPIHVRAGPQFPGVTVGDVIEAIHHELYGRVSSQRWAVVRGSQRELIKDAFRRRCSKTGRSPDHEGLLRCDWLLDQTYFKGLTPATGPGGQPIWKLSTGPPAV
ncbi:hypothetical protein BD410DRAFT_896233 [Rickenella mellea]|uniref:DUF6699 domain-containing protein n=1 Tax=Rickenella mellea TaxID=50990 RepID=A0A4Y7QEN6_9AGAM|nr:hypothetical protein BD410DRAFT_896233 [Rickenella mellea]